jgi:carbamoyl-phosphate synthase small subunit
LSSLIADPRPIALLALADGTIFRGRSIGATAVATAGATASATAGATAAGAAAGPAAHAVGEVVFNTAMTGYQEILTDPSYSRQIVTLTYPHIGNTGANTEDVEAARVHAAGLIVRDLPRLHSNFRAVEPLSDYLQRERVVAIADIDTRRLTRILRDRGAQAGAIVVGDDEARAVALARSFPGMAGLDLARVVSVREPYEWSDGTWQLGRGYAPAPAPKRHVVAFDFGVKHNILRMLADRGCRVTVVPAQTAAADAMRLKPDGIFLSNGPGDPEPCTYAIDASRELIERGYPTFGICLGHQIMGLASGGRTLKMKFGHHGANHPVQDLETGKVLITSQNHGFAVDPKTLPATCKVTHVSLFDGTLQGFRRTDRPAFCFQGHPEASPGPHDIGYLFDRFVRLMEAR